MQQAKDKTPNASRSELGCLGKIARTIASKAVRKPTYLLVGVLLLTGCQTTNQSHLYDRTSVSPDEDGWHQVRINGTVNHRKERIENMFLLRAAEETLKLGKKHFIYNLVELKRRDHYRVSTYYGVETHRTSIGWSYLLNVHFKPVPEDKIVMFEMASRKVLDAQDVYDRFKFMKPK